MEFRDLMSKAANIHNATDAGATSLQVSRYSGIHWLLGLIALAVLTWALLGHIKNEQTEQFLNNQMQLLSSAYNSVMDTYSLTAETVFYETTERQGVIEALAQANQVRGEEQNTVRDLVYEKLYTVYARMRERSLNEMELHLRDGAHFLRFHKPDEFGDHHHSDALELSRSLMAPISGFEANHSYNGLRYIFPLFNSGNYVGSLDIGVHFDAVRNRLSKLNPNYRYELLLKTTHIAPDVLSDPRSPYEAALLNPAYSRQEGLSVLDFDAPINDKTSLRLRRNLSKESDIPKRMLAGETFAKHTRIGGREYVATFIALQDTNRKNSGYVVAYARTEFLDEINREFVGQLLVSAVALAIIALLYQQLSHSRQRERDRQLSMQAMLEHAMDAILIFDASGAIESANPASEDTFQCPRDVMIGRSIQEFIPGLGISDPECDPNDLYAHLEKREYETEGRRHNGDRFPVGLSIGRMSFDGRARYIGLFRDITEQQNARMELVTAHDQAVAANQAKSAFLSSMSHELRTPLNAILGFSQLLHSDPAEPLSDDQRENVDEISKAGQHLLELINEILDLAKIEAGKIEMSIEPVELNELLYECIALIQPMADQYELELELFDLPEAELYIQADRTRLKQVLLNLLSNAVKYNRPGGSITLGPVTLKEDLVHIPVSDTGRGLTPEQLKQLFQPFNRVGREGSTIEGTGIGLTISRQLVNMMQGHIDVTSVAGVGSTFWVELHQAKVEYCSEDDDAAVPVNHLIDISRTEHTVLYIEDNTANLKLIERLLKRRPKIHLLAATNGTLGIEMATSHKPDLILLDINLPGINGYDVFNILKTDPTTCDIPIIAISANATQQDIDRATELGFVDYLTKPISVDHFFACVDEILEKELSQTA